MKKESILQGALILTITGFLTRIIGFYYRIYMTKTVGSEGIGLYQLIMPVYLLAWTITSSGISTTVSAKIAKKTALRQYKECIEIVLCSVIITGISSLIIECFVFLFAEHISLYFIKDMRSVSALKILALCFPFMSIGSAIRGYFYGIQNSSIPAVSQITEQLVRVFSVMGIFIFFVPNSLERACAVMATGIALGEFISFMFTVISFMAICKNIRTDYRKLSPLTHFRPIMSSALPLSGGRIISSVLSTAENLLIPQKLVLYGYTESNALSVYGKLTGMAMPLIQFPTAIITSFSTAMIPSISASKNIKNDVNIKKTIEKSLLFSSAAGIWAFTVFAFMPKQIAFLMYDQSSLGNIIIKLAPLCPLIYSHITLAGILNGAGRQNIIFLNNILSSIINLVFIEFSMNKIGINAFISGMFVSLCIVCIISLYVIIKSTSARLNIKNIVLKPVVCSLMSGFLLKINPLSNSFDKLHIISLLFILSIFYLLLLILTGCFKKDDIKTFIKRKKQA